MEQYNKNTDLRLGLYLGRHANFSGGIGVYISAMIDHYLQMIEDREIQIGSLILFGDKALLSKNAQEKFAIGVLADSQLEFIQLRGFTNRLAGFFYDQFLLPSYFTERRLSVVHSLANIAVLHSSVPQLVTIHDLYQGWPVEVEQGVCSVSLRNYFYRLIFTLQVKKVAALLAISNTTAAQINKYLPEASKKPLKVIPSGLDRVFIDAQTKRAELLKQRRSLPFGGGYVVLGFSNDPRKNFNRAISSWASLTSEDKRKGLVVIGAAGFEEHIKSYLHDSRDIEHVRCLPYLEREVLPCYLANAAAYLFPTLGEGFGFPVLEAVAMQTPVVATRLECLEQLNSELIFYCHSEDQNSISTALAKAIRFKREKVVNDLTFRTMKEATKDSFVEICQVINKRVCGDERKKQRVLAASN